MRAALAAKNPSVISVNMEADLVIKDAFVVDGTGRPGFQADVAVKDDTIAAISAPAEISAPRIKDAHGLVLAPGFVDIHGHSDYFVLILPGCDSKVLQGVTTEVGGNCGYSAAPIRGELARDRHGTHKELYDLDADWETFSQYMERLFATPLAMNYVPLTGFNTIRASAGCLDSRPPTPDRRRAMLDMTKEAMDAGAFGMSLGLTYAPGSFASADEIVDLARIVAERGGVVASHIRSEGEELIESIRESVEICRRAGVRFQVSHLKTSGVPNWGKLDAVFELIESGREQGLELHADRYPYLASFTQLSAALPPWVFEGGKEAFFQRLADRQARSRMREELQKREDYSDRWERVVVSQVFHDELNRYEGLSVARAAKDEGTDPVDFVCRLVYEAKDRVGAVYHTMSGDNLQRIYNKEWTAIGSDAAVRTHTGYLSEGKPHPRAFGTMPRMLSWVVKEKGWLDLPRCIRKMTSLPCEIMGIGDRGVISEGRKADLVLFNPAEIKDRATYDHPQQYPEGIDMVLVNGRPVAEDGKLTGVRTGEVLRRS